VCRQDTVTPHLILQRYLSCLRCSVPWASAVGASGTSHSQSQSHSHSLADLDPSLAQACADVIETLLQRDGLLESALARAQSLGE
jgi:hypothetical protein